MAEGRGGYERFDTSPFTRQVSRSLAPGGSTAFEMAMLPGEADSPARRRSIILMGVDDEDRSLSPTTDDDTSTQGYDVVDPRAAPDGPWFFQPGAAPLPPVEEGTSPAASTLADDALVAAREGMGSPHPPVAAAHEGMSAARPPVASLPLPGGDSMAAGEGVSRVAGAPALPPRAPFLRQSTAPARVVVRGRSSLSAGSTRSRNSSLASVARRVSELSKAQTPDVADDPSDAVHSSSPFKWTNRFQAVLSSPERNRRVSLPQLAADFIFAARLYGRVIVSERFLPDSMKTIKPVNSGGIAGGVKFFRDGILFKFPHTHQSSGGRLYRSDEHAAKVAGHELKSCSAVFGAGISELKVPLMVLLDYRGWRLQAMSMVPINQAQSTLVYGSSDGGATVCNDDPRLNKLIKQLAHHLNLKPHACGNPLAPVTLHVCTDLEGHRVPAWHESSDGMPSATNAVGWDYYLLDTARLFPPERPTPTVYNSQLFRLLRPELVRQSNVPLCSDTYVGMAGNDPKMPEHIEEVNGITDHLHQSVLPDFARLLDVLACRDPEFREVTSFARAFGINVRHFGKVRSFVSTDEARRVLLTEILARSLKNELRRLLRRTARSSSGDQHVVFVQAILDFLGLSFGGGLDSQFYRQSPSQLKAMTLARFPGALSEDEISPNLELMVTVSTNTRILVSRLLEMTGLKVSGVGLASIVKLAANLAPHDIVEEGERVKHLEVVSEVEGLLLLQELEAAVGSPDNLYGFDINVVHFYDAKASYKGQRAVIQDDDGSTRQGAAFGVSAREVDARLASLVWRTKSLIRSAVRSKPDDAMCRLAFAQVAVIQACRFLDLSSFRIAHANLELVVDYMERGQTQAMKQLNLLAEVTFQLTQHQLGTMILPFYTINRRQTKRLRDEKTKAVAAIFDLCREIHSTVLEREPSNTKAKERHAKLLKWRRTMARDSIICCGRHVCQRETILMLTMFCFAMVWTVFGGISRCSLVLGNDDELNGCGETVGHYDNVINVTATLAMVVATLSSMLWGLSAFPAMFRIVQSRLQRPRARSTANFILLLLLLVFYIGGCATVLEGTGAIPYEYLVKQRKDDFGHRLLFTANQVSAYLFTPLVPLCHCLNWAFRHSFRGAYNYKVFAKKEALVAKAHRAMAKANANRMVHIREVSLAGPDSLMTPLIRSGYSLRVGANGHATPLSVDGGVGPGAEGDLEAPLLAAEHK